MRFMLDTNSAFTSMCIYIIKRKPHQVLERLERIEISDVAISSITLAELEYGVVKSSRPEQNRDALSGFLSPLEILPFDDRAAFQYGKIRTYPESNGQVIGAMDMLIASHAISLSLVLVTNNIREFERIPELQLENWV